MMRREVLFNHPASDVGNQFILMLVLDDKAEMRVGRLQEYPKSC